DILLLPTVTDTLGTTTWGKLHVEVPSIAAISKDVTTRYRNDDGTASSFSLGVYASTTNTNTIAGAYDFRNRATPASAGLSASGNITVKANSTGAADPVIDLIGTTDLSGASSKLDATTTGPISLTEVSGKKMRIGTVQSVTSSVLLSNPD